MNKNNSNNNSNSNNLKVINIIQIEFNRRKNYIRRQYKRIQYQTWIFNIFGVDSNMQQQILVVHYTFNTL